MAFREDPANQQSGTDNQNRYRTTRLRRRCELRQFHNDPWCSSWKSAVRRFPVVVGQRLVCGGSWAAVLLVSTKQASEISRAITALSFFKKQQLVLSNYPALAPSKMQK